MKQKTDVATRPGATSGAESDERAGARVAVDHRRLLEVARDPEDEAAQTQIEKGSSRR
jgi:hypothetical protein